MSFLSAWLCCKTSTAADGAGATGKAALLCGLQCCTCCSQAAQPGRITLGQHAWICCLQDMQRPLYMQPKDALEYGIIDGIVKSQKKKDGDQIIDHVPRLEEYGRDVSAVMLLASMRSCACFSIKLQESCCRDMTLLSFGHEQWGAWPMCCCRVDSKAESRVGGRLLNLCLFQVSQLVLWLWMEVAWHCFPGLCCFLLSTCIADGGAL